jgi:hypothetical protein
MDAELFHDHGLQIGHNTVGLLMRRAGLTGLPIYRRRSKRNPSGVTVTDLIKRNFTRPNSTQYLHPLLQRSLESKRTKGNFFVESCWTRSPGG